MTEPRDDDGSLLASFTGDEDVESDAETSVDEARAHRRKRNRVLLITLAAFVAVVVLCGAIFVGLVLNQIGKVFKGNPIDALGSILGISGSALKTDAYGNTNIVVFGTTEGDPGHPSASNSLTDSIIVVSLNLKRKNAVMFSVPRDLWVTYPTQDCAVGTEGKINAVYGCGLNAGVGGAQGDEGAGQQALATTLSRVLGMSIQYTIHVNMTVVRDAVNAVGGITVLIHSPDPRGISEGGGHNRCNNACVLYPNGRIHLNGDQAMWLSQARNDHAHSYGLPRGDFDREMYQRQMAIAVEQKADQLSFLANPINALNLLDALGANMQTNIEASELGSFISAGRSIPARRIDSIDFVAQHLYTTGMYQTASIVRPVPGLYDYTALQAFTHKLLEGWRPTE